MFFNVNYRCRKQPFLEDVYISREQPKTTTCNCARCHTAAYKFVCGCLSADLIPLVLIILGDPSLTEKLAHLAGVHLDDIYQSAIPVALRRQYRLIFLWLKKFFLKVPDVTTERKNKALKFIRSIYEIYGFYLYIGGQA